MDFYNDLFFDFIEFDMEIMADAVEDYQVVMDILKDIKTSDRYWMDEVDRTMRTLQKKAYQSVGIHE